jgi:gluconokinase
MMMEDATTRRRAIVVMGVSGSGKTSVAERIAAERNLPMVEGDSLHPPANIAKIVAGTPLTDDDRWPWLDAIARRVAEDPRPELLVTCSALKRVYRDRLRRGAGRPLVFVYLHGERDLLAERINARTGHFAPAGLLVSQLATLEDPTGEPDVLRVEIDGSVEEVAARAEAALAALPEPPR